MNNKSLQRTRITFRLSLVVVTGLIFWFFINPRFSEPDQLQAQATATLDQKALLDQQTLALQRRQRYLPVAEKQVEILNKRFPSTADLAALNNEINQAAASAGIDVNTNLAISISPATVVGATSNPGAPTATVPGATSTGTAPQAASMSLAISAVGTYAQMNTFINNLYNINRAIAIDSVAYDAGGSGAGGYSAKIAGRAFLLSPIPPVPDNLKKPDVGTAPNPNASAAASAKTNTQSTTSAVPNPSAS